MSRTATQAADWRAGVELDTPTAYWGRDNRRSKVANIGDLLVAQAFDRLAPTVKEIT